MTNRVINFKLYTLSYLTVFVTAFHQYIHCSYKSIYNPMCDFHCVKSYLASRSCIMQKSLRLLKPMLWDYYTNSNPIALFMVGVYCPRDNYAIMRNKLLRTRFTSMNRQIDYTIVLTRASFDRKINLADKKFLSNLSHVMSTVHLPENRK